MENAVFWLFFALFEGSMLGKRSLLLGNWEEIDFGLSTELLKAEISAYLAESVDFENGHRPNAKFPSPQHQGTGEVT